MDDLASDRVADVCLELETLERELRGDRSAEIEAARLHLERCEACRERRRAMARGEAFLDRFASAAEPTPGATSSALRDELRHEFAGYEIVALLDFGGQGAVYRAIERSSGRAVAIKIPFGDPIRSPAKRYRFRREVELTGRLHHPSIVPVLAVCEGRGGRLGCVMELVEGTPFDAWTAARRAEPDGRRAIVAAVAEVADAMAYAHRRAVLHRDLKAGNVLVGDDGRPRILDFGLAKALDDEAGSFATMTGAFLGTLACAAPELLADGDGPDVRTDVYGLGLLLYVGIAGRLPWAQDLPMLELSRAVREQEPQRPSAIEGRNDPALDAIALTALAKDPSRRYDGAEAFAADLRRWLAGDPVVARFDGRWHLLRTAVRRHRRAIAAVASALAVVGALGVSSLSARAARQRELLAAAVRDARIVEAHAVAVERARAIARDNVAVGEPLLWDALLDPDPAVVEAGLEGAAALAGVPRSPAYWGLWETALRTPIVASLPRPLGRSSSFAADGSVIGCDGNAILRWSWRTGELVELGPTPIPVRDLASCVRAGPGWMLFLDRERSSVLVDTASMRRTELGSGVLRIAPASDLGTAIVRRLGQSAWRIEVFPLAATAPSHVGEVLPWEPYALASDGWFISAMDSVGRVSSWLPESDGSLRPMRIEGSPPPTTRYVWLVARGAPGEVLIASHGGIFAYRRDGDAMIGEAISARGPFALMRPADVEGSWSGGRFVGLSDRRHLIVGDARDDPNAMVVELPLVLTRASLAPDERHVVVSLEPDDRAAVVDLESDAIRRLDATGGVPFDGSRTIFDLRFVRDSSALLAASVDGSIVVHPVAGGPLRPLLNPQPGAGVTRIVCDGDRLVVGIHDHERDDAPLRIVRDGRAVDTAFVGERWICGVEVGEDAIWVLAGDGGLARLSRDGSRIEAERRIGLHRDRPGVRRLLRLPQRGLLLVGPAGEGVEVFDERTLEPVGPSLPMRPFYDMATSPSDPELLAVGMEDGTIEVGRIAIGADAALRFERVRRLGSHAGPVFRLAFHPEGELLASVCGSPERGDLRLWEVASGRELASLDLFAYGGFALAFSPDGRWLAAGGEAHPDRMSEGGQLFLLDIEAPARAIAGNLEYHAARIRRERGREALLERDVRAWLAPRRVARGESSP